jgi:hypothetical protein
VETSIKPNPLRDFATDEAFKAALAQSTEAARAEGGRANLGAVGSHLVKLLLDFDARNYGFSTLSDLVEKIPTLAVSREKAGRGTQVYVRRK